MMPAVCVVATEVRVWVVMACPTVVWSTMPVAYAAAMAAHAATVMGTPMAMPILITAGTVSVV